LAELELRSKTNHFYLDIRDGLLYRALRLQLKSPHLFTKRPGRIQKKQKHTQRRGDAQVPQIFLIFLRNFCGFASSGGIFFGLKI